MTGSGGKDKLFTPDRLIHEPARLQILSYLAAGGKQVSFNELKEKLAMTPGNLSVQLKRLEDVGYLSIKKSISDRRPLTRVSLTRQGLEALQQYLRELEEMIGRVKKRAASITDTDKGG